MQNTCWQRDSASLHVEPSRIPNMATSCGFAARFTTTACLAVYTLQPSRKKFKADDSSTQAGERLLAQPVQQKKEKKKTTRFLTPSSSPQPSHHTYPKPRLHTSSFFFTFFLLFLPLQLVAPFWSLAKEVNRCLRDPCELLCVPRSQNHFFRTLCWRFNGPLAAAQGAGHRAKDAQREKATKRSSLLQQRVEWS